MRVFIGLDVSLAKTAVCVVDRDGAVQWQGKVSSEPGPLIKAAGAVVRCYRAGRNRGLSAVGVAPSRASRGGHTGGVYRDATRAELSVLAPR
jgi:hypothetical protein